MRVRVWEGVLPRYWTESPWFAVVGTDLLLLVPEAEGRVLMRVTLNGEVVWRRKSSSQALLVAQDGSVLTARVRDGRSDAVYFQFTVHDAFSGEIMWQLAPGVEARRPKSVVHPFATTVGQQVLVELDRWRDIRTGAPTTPSESERGTHAARATYLKSSPNGIRVTWQGHSREIPELSNARVIGLTHSLLIGWTSGRLWVRSLFDGTLKVEVDHNDGLVDPSGEIGGLAHYFESRRTMVPLAAVMLGERMGILREDSVETALYDLPEMKRLDAWDAGAMVVLVGATASGYLVVEENNDGTGCMWLCQ